MSKQSEAKVAQGYVSKAIPSTCCNCVNYEFDKVQTVQPTSMHPNGWWEDKNKRCGLGGFAVKMIGTCNKFELKS